MKKNLLILGAIIILLALGIGIYIFMQKTSPINSTDNETNPFESVMPAANIPLTYQITMSEYKFSPLVTIVPRGSIVVWTNNDLTTHTVTSDSGIELHSPLMSNGTTYTHTFNVSGTFDYHCSIHTYMKGEVIVQ